MVRRLPGGQQEARARLEYQAAKKQHARRVRRARRRVRLVNTSPAALAKAGLGIVGIVGPWQEFELQRRIRRPHCLSICGGGLRSRQQKAVA